MSHEGPVPRLVGLIVVMAGIAGFFVVQAAGSSQASGNRATGSAEPSGPTYSIFEGGSSWARLPAATQWKPPPDPRIGALLSEARLVHQDSSRIVVAVPAAKAPCLMTRLADGSEGASCGLAPDEHPSSVGYSGAIGLVPDGVETVTFAMTDGSVRVGAVRDNVWKSPVEAATASYSYDGRAYDVELMPRSSLPAGTTIGRNGVVSGGDLTGFGG